MLRYFLEQQQDEAKRLRHARLFDNLAICETEIFARHFARYPVIFLTFKDVKETSFASALQQLMLRISTVVRDFFADPKVREAARSVRDRLDFGTH